MYDGRNLFAKAIKKEEGPYFNLPSLFITQSQKLSAILQILYHN